MLLSSSSEKGFNMSHDPYGILITYKNERFLHTVYGYTEHIQLDYGTACADLESFDRGGPIQL